MFLSLYVFDPSSHPVNPLNSFQLSCLGGHEIESRLVGDKCLAVFWTVSCQIRLSILLGNSWDVKYRPKVKATPSLGGCQWTVSCPIDTVGRVNLGQYTSFSLDNAEQFEENDEEENPPQTSPPHSNSIYYI